MAEIEPVKPNEPQAGFYKTRLVRGGPWVGVKIWLEDGERETCDNCGGLGFVGMVGETCEACAGTGTWLISDQRWRCLVDGREVDVFKAWPYVAVRPIEEAEYDYMTGAADWDRKYDPGAPAANPRKPLDINKTRPVFE